MNVSVGTKRVLVFGLLEIDIDTGGIDPRLGILRYRIQPSRSDTHGRSYKAVRGRRRSRAAYLRIDARILGNHKKIIRHDEYPANAAPNTTDACCSR